MGWDDWPLAVLAMTLFCAARPAWAGMALRQAALSQPDRYPLVQIGGGVTMVTLAVYLATQCRQFIGYGYWDLPLRALQDPYMRMEPGVWIPVLCWIALVVLGPWWTFAGMKRRAQRDVTSFVWALNETVITTALLAWHVSVPLTWPHEELIGFMLQGLYLSCLAGALVRLMVALLGTSFDGTSAGSSKLGGTTSARFHRMRR